jgi:uncharacterized protein (TIGR03435 family)
MASRRTLKLNRTKRLALATAGLAAMVLPFCIGIVAAPRVRAQTEVMPTFEVASIKRIDTALCDPPLQGTMSPGRLHICGPLSYFIQTSYDLYTKKRGLSPGLYLGRKALEIEGAPEWLNSERYQIEATAAGPASYAVMAGPMMQALLEDRLKLKAHHETRNVPVYELTATKAGPKLQRSGNTCVPFDPIVRAQEAEAVATGRPRTTFCARTNVGTGTIDFLDMTLSEFAKYLGNNLVDRPVLNTIEMAGRFNLHLEFPPNDVGAVWNGRSNSDGRAMNLVIVALQEQLGLRLERATGPDEFLVIDSVVRPSEN